MKHELKYCERCGSAFECKPGNITQCQCYEFQIEAAVKAKLGEEYSDCLCGKCLREIVVKMEGKISPSENIK